MNNIKLITFLLPIILSPATGNAQTVLEAGSGIADINFVSAYPKGQYTFALVPIKYYLEPRLSLAPDKPSVCRILDFSNMRVQIQGLFTGGVVWQDLPVSLESGVNGDRLAATLPVPYGYTTYGVKGHMRIKCPGTSANESVQIYAYNTNIDSAHAWSATHQLQLDPERTVKLSFTNPKELGALRKNSRYSFQLFTESQESKSVPHKIYVNGKLLESSVNITEEESDYQMSIDKSGTLTVITGNDDGDFNQELNVQLKIE